MSQRNVTIAIILAAIGFLVSSALFTVQETELAMKFRLGEIVKADYEPGLHWKIPFINNVKTFDKRILTLDATPAKYLTKEKKNVLVDFFVKWRITDVKAFYKSISNGSIVTANNRLYSIINDDLRGEFSNRTIQEVISGERREIMQKTTEITNEKVKGLGIQVVDVRIKRIDYEQSISDSVFRRMMAERQRVAKEFRALGAEEAEKISANADRQRTVILADAYRASQELRGEGDAKAADIYAKAYSKDAEFYAFFRSLEAYKQSFKDQGSVLVLEPNSEFFNYFKKYQTQALDSAFMLDTLLIALALFFVIEGLLPTLSPGGYRRAMEMVAQMSDRSIRTWGLFSMILGTILLYFFKP